MKNWQSSSLKKPFCVASVFMEERYSTGYNLAGFINNGKPKTVVLGAHYDHIGMGKENSLYQGEPAIHNGADDNGSHDHVVGDADLLRR